MELTPLKGVFLETKGIAPRVCVRCAHKPMLIPPLTEAAPDTRYAARCSGCGVTTAGGDNPEEAWAAWESFMGGVRARGFRPARAEWHHYPKEVRS